MTRRAPKPEQGLLFAAERVEVTVLPTLVVEPGPVPGQPVVRTAPEPVVQRVVWLDPDHLRARVAVSDGEREAVGLAYADGTISPELAEVGAKGPTLGDLVVRELAAWAQRRAEDDERAALANRRRACP